MDPQQSWYDGRFVNICVKTGCMQSDGMQSGGIAASHNCSKTTLHQGELAARRTCSRRICRLPEQPGGLAVGRNCSKTNLQQGDIAAGRHCSMATLQQSEFAGFRRDQKSILLGRADVRRPAATYRRLTQPKSRQVIPSHICSDID